VLAVGLPTAGMLLSLALGGRLAARTALFLLPAGLGLAFAIVTEVWRSGGSLVYFLGGWAQRDFMRGQRSPCHRGCPSRAPPWFSGCC